MFEHNQPTLPFDGARSIEREKTVPSAPEVSPIRKMLRLGTIVVGAALSLVIGSAMWSYFGTSKVVDDNESVANWENFEAAPPFVSAPANPDASQLRPKISSRLGPPSPIDANVPDRNAGILAAPQKPIDASDVWLTGTIEDPEPSERIALPKQLSGGPHESSILR